MLILRGLGGQIAICFRPGPRGRRAAWPAFYGSRSRANLFCVQMLLRQYGGVSADSVAAANGAYARRPHRPPVGVDLVVVGNAGFRLGFAWASAKQTAVRYSEEL